MRDHARTADSALPDALNSVAVEDCIDADEGRAQFQALGGKQAVEWVAVVEGQERGANGVERMNLDEGELLFAQNAEKVGHKDVRLHFAPVHLERDFPGDYRRNQNLIVPVLDELPSALAESSGLVHCPKAPYVCRAEVSRGRFARFFPIDQNVEAVLAQLLIRFERLEDIVGVVMLTGVPPQ